MKALIFLFGLLLLNSRCDAQTNFSSAATVTATQNSSVSDALPTTTTIGVPAATPSTDNSTASVETTTGSGDGPTESPVCPDNYCNGKGECKPGTTDGNFTCTCDTGYSGDTCDEFESLECESVTETVYNGDVHQDYNCSAYSDDNSTIQVTFGKTEIGDTAFSDKKCKSSCDEDDDTKRSIATKKCGPNGWEEVQIKDCGETDQVSNALEDFNPDTATDKDVTDTIEVIENTVTTEDEIPSEDADTILAVTNEVLSTDSDASSTVTENSKSILDSMDKLSNKVVLEKNKAGYSEYSEEDSNIALAVVAEDPDPRAFSSDTFYYGTDSEWGEDLNLAASDLQLTTTELEGSYMSAKPVNADVRISYKFYSDGGTLFPEIAESVTNGIVYSATGNIGGTYTFKFKLIDDTLTKDDIMCAHWDRSAAGWNEESECEDYSVEGSFGFCVCSEDGEYTMRKSIDEGLSAGAIAGIVVGSVVGVALIGGGVYYFAFYKKKNKKATKVKPANSDVEMTRGHDNHAESSDDD